MAPASLSFLLENNGMLHPFALAWKIWSVQVRSSKRSAEGCRQRQRGQWQPSRASRDLRGALSRCGSGKELLEKGFELDVEFGRGVRGQRSQPRACARATCWRRVPVPSVNPG